MACAVMMTERLRNDHVMKGEETMENDRENYIYLLRAFIKSIPSSLEKTFINFELTPLVIVNHLKTLRFFSKIAIHSLRKFFRKTMP